MHLVLFLRFSRLVLTIVFTVEPELIINRIKLQFEWTFLLFKFHFASLIKYTRKKFGLLFKAKFCLKKKTQNLKRPKSNV